MLTVLGGALLIAGCGGGGGGGPVSTGGTGASTPGTASSANGAITGFGSIIVGGVRYDDSAASILDDDGASLRRGDLKLGMVVRIKGGKKSDDGVSIRAKADSIEVHSELQGPIDLVTATSITVLGQTATISATTFFGDGLTAATLATGTMVEVHGFVNPVTNSLTATRIERKAEAKVFKLQGAISGLNTASKTFNIGSLTISYLTADLPTSLMLANALVVRVRLAVTPLTGTRTALKIRKPEYEHEDHDEAEVEGIVTSVESSTRFSVNGLPVDASVSTVPVGVVIGARVEVEGRLVNGVLVARKIELEDDEGYEEDNYKFELHGTVSALDTTVKTFVLRGLTVDYTKATYGIGLTVTGLRNGANVEVKGVRSETNGILATRISLEN
ncbi:MAG: DUF5666 domain-containing protein [Polaromonas sp.]|nr:DUF5666 domain-containing protein [Polaromonas sp.]